MVAGESATVRYLGDATFESGGAGLVSTARDYLRFSQMMLNGGSLDGARILSPKAVELMTTNHLGDIQMGSGRSGVGFGLGFAVVLNPGDVGAMAPRVNTAGEVLPAPVSGSTPWRS